MRSDNEGGSSGPWTTSAADLLSGSGAGQVLPQIMSASGSVGAISGPWTTSAILQAVVRAEFPPPIPPGKPDNIASTISRAMRWVVPPAVTRMQSRLPCRTIGKVHCPIANVSSVRLPMPPKGFAVGRTPALKARTASFAADRDFADGGRVAPRRSNIAVNRLRNAGGMGLLKCEPGSNLSVPNRAFRRSTSALFVAAKAVCGFRGHHAQCSDLIVRSIPT